MNLRQTTEIIVTLLAFGFLAMQTACDTGQRHVSGIDSLVLEVWSSRSRAQVGQLIQIKFTITNRGRNHIVLESPDTPVMDIVVSPYGSDEIFLKWSDQNPDQVAHRLEWKPGESKTIELVWTPKPGETWYGATRYVGISGKLYRNSKSVQSAGVMICASNACP